MSVTGFQRRRRELAAEEAERQATQPEKPKRRAPKGKTQRRSTKSSRGS